MNLPGCPVGPTEETLQKDRALPWQPKKLQEDGTLLADVAGSFVKKFESYALQRSMGQQLIEYAFPARSNFEKAEGRLVMITMYIYIFKLWFRGLGEQTKLRKKPITFKRGLSLYNDDFINLVVIFVSWGQETRWKQEPWISHPCYGNLDLEIACRFFSGDSDVVWRMFFFSSAFMQDSFVTKEYQRDVWW